MSHPALIYPSSLDVAPSTVSGAVVPDTFDICVRYKGSADRQHLLHAHIPESVQAFFGQGRVRGFSFASVPANSAAARSFPRQPIAVVTGVELDNGERLNCVPQQLSRAYWFRVVAGVLGVVVGLGAALNYQSVAGAIVAGLATHLLRTAAGIPNKPAW